MPFLYSRSLRTAAAAAALAVLIPAATMAPADAAVGKPVDIVKIRYDLPGNDGSGNRQYVQEFIQLRNVSGRPVNLTGYRVQDDGAKHTFAFPRNFVLGAGKTVEVHSGKGRATGSIQYWNTTSFVWNNDHDRATLRDGRGKVLETCGYVGTYAKGGATKTC